MRKWRRYACTDMLPALVVETGFLRHKKEASLGSLAANVTPFQRVQSMNMVRYT